MGAAVAQQCECADGTEFTLEDGGCSCLVAKLCPTLVTPSTVLCQAPLSVEFSRQEHWSGVPFPAAGDLPHPGIKPKSPVSPAVAGRFFTPEPAGKPFAQAPCLLPIPRLCILVPAQTLCQSLASESPSLGQPQPLPWGTDHSPLLGSVSSSEHFRLHPISQIQRLRPKRIRT